MIRKISLLLVLAMTASAAWAQLLWRVEGNGLSRASYLMGTHHFALASYIDSVKGLNEAIEACDAVYGELHYNDMSSQQAQQKLMMSLIAPADSTLDKVLTPEQYALVQKVADKYLTPMGASLDMLKMLKPQGVVIQLQALQAMAYFKDYNPNNQIDRGVQLHGEAMGKQVGALETLDEQIAILFSSPITEQAEGLIEMCEQDADFVEVSNKLSEAYINQDLDYMLKQFTNPDAGSTPTEQELERLLWGRNRKWVEKLKELMPQQSIMVCVGAGHLPGEKGLVNLLRNAGYTVTPISK